MVHNGILLGGINISWNIGALYTRKNDIHKIEVQRQMNDNLKETFLFNNRLQNEDADGNIQSIKRQLTKDAQIAIVASHLSQQIN